MKRFRNFLRKRGDINRGIQSLEGIEGHVYLLSNPTLNRGLG